MARRKLTVVEQAMKDAAAELGLPKDHWDVERLATLNVMLEVARHKWSAGQATSDANQMLALMEAITALRRESKASEAPQISVEIVRKLRGKCWHCGKENEVGRLATDAALAEPQRPPPNSPPRATTSPLWCLLPRHVTRFRPPRPPRR